MRVRHCHAWGCGTPCKSEYLMCLRHWRMVAARIRTQVYVHYQAGQCHGVVTPSREWHVAADAAIRQFSKKNIHPQRGKAG